MPPITRTVAATALLLTCTVRPASAAAGGALQFAGDATVDCYGCGFSQGQLSGTYTSVVDGLVRSGSFVADLVLHPGSNCLLPASFTATFTFAGWGSASLTMTYAGAAYVSTFRTPEGYTAAVAGTWVVTSPIGNPCGVQWVDVNVTGAGPIAQL